MDIYLQIVILIVIDFMNSWLFIVDNLDCEKIDLPARLSIGV